MIECRGVSFSYDGAVSALDGVDLNIEDGEFFCILGGNGSGKSTFAKHLNALLQSDAGTVRINGMDASDPELVYDIRSTVGMVFQNPDNQIIGTVVEEDVGFGPENMGISTGDIWKRVDESLAKTGMTAYRHHSPNKLSGGQKQRVAIARALINNPDILLADEPTGALDSETSIQVMELLKEIAKDKLVIMVTHNPELAKQYANRIVRIKDGTLTGDSNPYTPASGLIGVGISYLAIIPINAIVYNLTGIEGLKAFLPPQAAAVLVAISMVLTLIAGLIPSRVASQKDPVEALRTE